MSARKHEEDNSRYAAQSMAGHVAIKDMGAGVKPGGEKPAQKPQKPAVSGAFLENPQSEHSGVFDSNLESISYRPKSAATRLLFEALMAGVRVHIPDESHKVILLAADAILELLKDENNTITQKRALVESLLSVTLSDAEMAKLVDLARDITDYEAEQPESDGEVAIAFEEDTEEAGEHLHEIQDGADPENGEIPGENDQIPPKKDDSETPEALQNGDGSVVISSAALSGPVFVELEDVTEDLIFNKVSALEPDTERDEVLETCKKVSRALVANPEDLETTLVQILEFKHLDFVKFCIQNRTRIVYGLKLRKNREKAIEQMRADAQVELLRELGRGKRKHSEEEVSVKRQSRGKSAREPRIVDLDSLVFEQGPQLMATAKVVLPKGSYQQNKKLYDTIHIPAPSAPPSLEESNEALVSISELPSWAQAAFPEGETQHLNRIQSKVYPSAFSTDENLLLCAPTGAGKTNVAMLAALRVLSNHRNSEGKFNLKQFKIVYVAPLKALVSEQMREFRRRLTSQYGITVNEFTGDASLSQKEIADTQILVTTPEKWDVATRAAHPYTTLVKLLIVDEVHLLHDDRGPVLELIIVRAKRNTETRIVGLSATLPNYEDVAQFLSVPKSGLYYFDARYRPCPLEQEFIGIKEKKAVLKILAMNEACHEKLVQCRKNGHQLIIFVHSRKDTVKTAKWLAAKSEEEVKGATKEILRQEAENVKNGNLAEILPAGFGVHHAGLDKDDRSLVEDLFAQGHLQVLVSTATLAWGVNLPAHSVVIKGTETYNPEKGAWVQLSPQDILQMLGRAGRPRYDVSGEGVIITSHDELQYYMAVLNQQLPIESQFMKRLCDNLNAEIALGSVQSREEAVAWLAQTYLYVRMLKSPKLYQVGAEYSDDPLLEMKRTDLVHSALVVLHRDGLVQYDSQSGQFCITASGKIAAQFYIGHESMALYDAQLKPCMSQIDLLRIFSCSGEFKYVPVRQEEKLEVLKLSEKCPIPIKEGANDARTKINVLLQAYISRLKLDGFALLADMIYVTQSAGRLLRALHQLCVKRKWALLALETLDLCKFVERRMWNTNSPFRQYTNASTAIIKATEASHLPFSSYFQLSAAELSEAINFKGNSQLAHDLLRQFPKISMSCVAQPVSPEFSRVSVEIVAEWTWSWELHGASESFLLLVEDGDGENILYEQKLKITKNMVNREFQIDFAIQSSAPLPPSLFVTVVSERWLHSQWREPIKMFDVKSPKTPHSPTAVLDVQSVPVKALRNEQFEEFFAFSYFNKYISQSFGSLWNTNDSVFLGLSKGSGKTLVAELAILNAWRQNKQRVWYLQPSAEKAKKQTKLWQQFRGLTAPPKVVACLTGDSVQDTRLVALSHLVVGTPEHFDAVSRRWRHRKAVQMLDLVVADDLHMLDTAYESVLSRVRFMAAQLEREVRIVALSNPLIYARETADWLGCSKANVYNFSPMCRTSPLEIRITPYESYAELSADFSPGLVFFSDRQAAVEKAPLVMEASHLERFSSPDIDAVLPRVSEKSLARLLQKGVALYYDGMDARDRALVEQLAAKKLVPLILASKDTCAYAPKAEHVVIYGSQAPGVFPADYFLSEFLDMVGCATKSVHAHIYAPKVDYYSRFLSEPMPMESSLSAHAHDVFLHEIAAKTFETKQDCVDYITYTLFYRRVTQNPSFYGLKDVSHLGISEYLSEIVENTLEDLEATGLVELDEDEIAPLNGAMISSHYSVSYETMTAFVKLGEKARLRSILESVTSADLGVLVRSGEEEVLYRLAQKVPLKLAPGTDFELPHVKAFLLLQAHFLRISLLSELKSDQQRMLEKALRLVHAVVDTLSSEGHLNALQAMDLSQMIVQGLWARDSPLKQIPHMDEEMMARCQKYNVETIYDVMSLEDEERDDVLRLEDERLQDVAEFVNKYPNVDVLYTRHGDQLTVVLERDEEMEDLSVVTPYLPKTEHWWIVVGDAESRQLYAIKKAQIKHERQEVEMQVLLPPGKHTIWCMCDSYIDADKEMSLEVQGG